MRIQKKRVRKIDSIVSAFAGSPMIYVAFFPQSPEQMQLVERAGFSDTTARDVKVLPSEISPVTRYNARGKNKILRDLPKEPFTRWCWITDWNGDDHYVSIPGMRYPRQHMPAPEEEIALTEADGKPVVLSEPLTNQPSEHDRILHVVNVFLSLFGECVILDSEKSTLCDMSEVKRVNWRIFPKGNMMWSHVETYVKGIRAGGPSRQKERAYCLHAIHGHSPDEIYAGNGGFGGYLVFVYKALNMSIMENFRYGNATYIFKSDWQDVSKLSKGEILNDNLHDARLIHNNEWKVELDALFPPAP